MYQAILVFTGQDLPSYMKGGWLLRKAWKIYEKLFKEVTTLREKSKFKVSSSQASFQSTDTKKGDLPTSDSKTSMSGMSTTSSTDSGPMDGNDNQIPPEVLDRLQGDVNFGYGTFQICISMIPPKILKLIEFLGFEGDRVIGLKALEYTCNSDSMNEPLATLGLLWYHTVLRPFFALDGANGYDAGIVNSDSAVKFKCTLTSVFLPIYTRV